MHDENNANVTDEIASRQVVQDMQDAQSTNNNELFASSSAQEHDYIAVDDEFVSATKKLDEDEDVEWIWTHTADGESVVTGYIITKRTVKPGQRSDVSDDSNRTSSIRSR